MAAKEAGLPAAADRGGGRRGRVLRRTRRVDGAEIDRMHDEGAEARPDITRLDVREIGSLDCGRIAARPVTLRRVRRAGFRPVGELVENQGPTILFIPNVPNGPF
ncbi:hypothetical protein ACFHW2_12470 [Actinomadura sp. LOL_016]|uniref:hypothetical protein n=1 Tax=unclassified Actinomadura TaxID=2626254 RepID=UPI003A80F461